MRFISKHGLPAGIPLTPVAQGLHGFPPSGCHAGGRCCAQWVKLASQESLDWSDRWVVCFVSSWIGYRIDHVRDIVIARGIISQDCNDPKKGMSWGQRLRFVLQQSFGTLLPRKDPLLDAPRQPGWREYVSKTGTGSKLKIFNTLSHKVDQHPKGPEAIDAIVPVFWGCSFGRQEYWRIEMFEAPRVAKIQNQSKTPCTSCDS